MHWAFTNYSSTECRQPLHFKEEDVYMHLLQMNRQVALVRKNPFSSLKSWSVNKYSSISLTLASRVFYERIFNRLHQLIVHKVQNCLALQNRLGKLPWQICSCLRSCCCQLRAWNCCLPILCCWFNCTLVGEREKPIIGRPMPKGKAKLLLCPKCRPAGREQY